MATSIPNLVKISQIAAELWRFSSFQKSWPVFKICRLHIDPQLQYLGLCYNCKLGIDVENSRKIVIVWLG